MLINSSIPVIDLFAGPGGLSEGFSSYRTVEDHQPFSVKLSIEKDTYAHRTLQLRSFLRQFGDRVPDDYYTFLTDTTAPVNERLASLFKKHPAEAEGARNDAWLAELGREPRDIVRERIASSLGPAELWVLLGGPPCQAYSLAGRSRNKGNANYVPEADARQYLYVEYLQVIAEHRPAVFVMENVKGLLSATLQNQRMFEKILADLRKPAGALRREGRCVSRDKKVRPEPIYEIFSLTNYPENEGVAQDFVVRMERHGIPQARHRLILLGVRSDLVGDVTPEKLQTIAEVPARKVLEGLPKVRSGISRSTDDTKCWIEHLRDARNQPWVKALDKDIHRQVSDTLAALDGPQNDRGGEFVSHDVTTEYQSEWYLDPRLRGACNHSTRGHILPDLYRYLYASCFARARGRSPLLGDFPSSLLPNHENVTEALGRGNFADRFRVQLSSRPSTTVTSHIAKDGHYYIHYDPAQCRSLTMREAARLQTFPDNYFFCGPRTAQYSQVGNAVPPLLAHSIAEIVLRFLKKTGAVR